MKYALALIMVLCFASCSHKYHTVKVAKPVYHHGYYKNHKFHRKLQVGRVRIRWFEKQGVKTVRMKG